ncbi:hypothetical protein KY285_023018 [Solanum tuberosum]|nr:hypothetical protein KY285_023018 [Solanum tuberosum]
MFLHPVAGHLVAIFGTSNKKLVVLLPMMLIFFVLSSQFKLCCSGGEGRTDESPLKQSCLDQKEACKLAAEVLVIDLTFIFLRESGVVDLEFYCNEVYYSIPPINVKKHRKLGEDL